MKYTLDLSHYNKKMKVLGQLHQRFDMARANAVDEIVEKLNIKLLDKLAEYGLSNSRLASRIRIRPIANKGVSIVVDSKYAMFVEFGTGMVGEGDPHPRAKRDAWVYDENGHGSKGWWYPTVEEDPNPTAYMGSDGEWYAWTAGSPARPFMYETWLYGTRMAYSVLQKHIRRVGL